jgi:AcrR family transcriptional regulator
MLSRQRLLEAAARVYAESGFRGATTRRIAEAAGVNEVTLFRLFGSKSALIQEAIQSQSPTQVRVTLPDVPVDPLAELTAWCNAVLSFMRSAKGMIRKSMAEVEERPEMAPSTCAGPAIAYEQLRAYALRLVRRKGNVADADVGAAVTMLFNALFCEAVGRDFMTSLFPHAERDAAELYARAFLRSLGVRVTGAAPPNGRARAGTRVTKPRARSRRT